ncbi:MAG: ATP-binding protein [Phycisphaerales bacterium]|nr:ATP-binding protein [Phycisphaerales bacterium]
MNTEIRQPKTLRYLSTVAGVYAIIGGGITLLGWQFNVPRLTNWHSNGIAMFPNAAACAVLCGAALFMLHRNHRDLGQRIVVCFCAALVSIVGGLTLHQHLFSVNLGIDTFLFNLPWGQRAAVAPMRMGPPESASFLILGMGLLLATLGPRSRRFASLLAVLPVAIASLSLIGYWYGADQLFGVARLTGIALQTSTMLAALGLGLMAVVPEHGLMAMFRRDDAGGVLARRLLLPVIALPLLTGWLRVSGQKAGFYDTAFGTALVAIGTVTILASTLCWIARGLSRQAQIALAAEQAVRDSKSRLTTILGQLPVGVGVVDRNGRWIVSNALMRTFVPSTIPSRDPGRVGRWRARGPDGRDIARDQWPIARAFAGEIVSPGIEFTYTPDDGREVYTLVSTAPLRNHDGTIHAVVAVVQDIDGRKRAEVAVQAALDKRTTEVTRAERALATAQRMAAVGTLASGLAHDIDNVLWPLSARMDGVLADPGLGADARSSLAAVVALLDHLRAMSKNLCLFARDPEQEGIEGFTDLADWRSGVQGFMEASLAGKDSLRRELREWLKLSFDVPSGLPPVKVAPHRLTQAVLNLIHNARDAIVIARSERPAQQEPGCITVEARANPDGSAVKLKVIDDGCGMDDETIRRSVEPFFTTKDRPRAAGMGGSGMGLTLAQSICDRVGGQLEIESALDKGTTVTMTLPVVTPSPALDVTVVHRERSVTMA